MEHGALEVGMFWAGLLVASIPIGLAVGVGIFVLRQHWISRSARPPDAERD